MKGDSICEAIICEKGLEIYDDLTKNATGAISGESAFKASRGWFEKFEKRSRMHSVIRHGERTTSDKQRNM